MIEVEQLELRDGSQISSVVWNFGQGNSITIKANEIVLSSISEIEITNAAGIKSPSVSGIVSASYTSRPDAVASTVNIEAKHLVIEDLAQINVASLNLGNAGSINLKVEKLEIKKGGGIISTALGLGDGGSINIKANDIVLSEVGFINSSGFGPGEGKAGDITIETFNLELIQGGNINVSTVGLGKSGAINLKVSDSLRLSGQADESMFLFYDFANGQIGGLLPGLGIMPEDLVGPSKISAAVIKIEPIKLDRAAILAIGSKAGRLNGYCLKDVGTIALGMDSVIGIELKEKMFGSVNSLAKFETTGEIEWQKVLGKIFAGFGFHHNYTINGYRVDFYVDELNLICECNGYDNNIHYNQTQEKQREEYLNKNYRVVRFHHLTDLETLVNGILHAQVGTVVKLYDVGHVYSGSSQL